MSQAEPRGEEEKTARKSRRFHVSYCNEMKFLLKLENF